MGTNDKWDKLTSGRRGTALVVEARSGEAVAVARALGEAAAREVPKARLLAVEASAEAMRTLVDLMRNEETPAAVRRLAALDVLGLAGVEKVEKGNGGGGNADEITTEQLRALVSELGRQVEAATAIQGQVIDSTGQTAEQTEQTNGAPGVSSVKGRRQSLD